MDKLECRLVDPPSSHQYQLSILRVRDTSTSRTRHICIEKASIAAAETSSNGDLFAYRAAVFIVLCCLKEAVVVARFLTYNEQLIETVEFGLTSEADLGRLRKYVIDRLGRMVFVSCPGVREERLQADGIDAAAASSVILGVTLAEKVGESVRYRSRHCARIIAAAEAEGMFNVGVIWDYGIPT